MKLDEVMADEIAMKEEEELEALIHDFSREEATHFNPNALDGSMWDMYSGDPASTTSVLQDPPALETPYGSDDEEYDHIFMGVIQEEDRVASQQPPPEDHEMMDMS